MFSCRFLTSSLPKSVNDLRPMLVLLPQSELSYVLHYCHSTCWNQNHDIFCSKLLSYFFQKTLMTVLLPAPAFPILKNSLKVICNTYPFNCFNYFLGIIYIYYTFTLLILTMNLTQKIFLVIFRRQSSVSYDNIMHNKKIYIYNPYQYKMLVNIIFFISGLSGLNKQIRTAFTMNAK